MTDEYQCAACGGMFEKGWTDEEADAERKELFPNLAESESAIVCDDCFKKVVFG